MWCQPPKRLTNLRSTTSIPSPLTRARTRSTAEAAMETPCRGGEFGVRQSGQCASGPAGMQGPPRATPAAASPRLKAGGRWPILAVWVRRPGPGSEAGMKTIPDLESHLFELIRRASTKLPADVTAALGAGQGREAAGSAAATSLATILENVELSERCVSPICQDTGTPVFYVKHPWDYPVRPIREAALAAIRRATKESLLRPNAVDSVTGANSNDNTGEAFPSFSFEQWEEPDALRFDLLLKGGGSENQSAQYSLPHGGLKAGRDLEGVRRVILDAVVNAQGQGCGPAILGVCIGGDRASSYALAKKQLLRPLADPS
ncbi:fumarate hydratase, partial [bacterium]|nr:fumarate hydratase [bacterium]